MAESEETRVTDAEVEAAAKAICEGRSDDWTIPDQRMNAEDDARAALEAAAALHPPREGVDEKTSGRRTCGACSRKVMTAGTSAPCPLTLPEREPRIAKVRNLEMGELNRDDIRDVLAKWRDYEWQVQGFGMLRIYLPGPGEPRLQVWDQRLATWSNNAIHDHPWAFTSTIFAGTIFNQRYLVYGDDYDPTPKNGHSTEIIPGTRGGQLTERPVIPVYVKPQPVEVYAMGESYSQTHREMHLTKYLPGTVTLITRSGRESADIARVAWYGKADEQPPFVNPYPATPELAERIIGDALKAWWL